MWGVVKFVAGTLAVIIGILVVLDSALFANLLKKADES
jgi:hypothetical protein